MQHSIVVPKFPKHFDDMNQAELRFAVAELVKVGQKDIGLGRCVINRIQYLKKTLQLHHFRNNI